MIDELIFMLHPAISVEEGDLHVSCHLKCAKNIENTLVLESKKHP
jgi:hypothetical protein